MAKAFAYGYGTTVDDLEFRQDAARRIFEVFSDKRSKKFVRDWKKEYPELDWERCLTVMMIKEGPEKMIAEVINENVFGGQKIIAGEKGAIYAGLLLPKNEAARKALPLEKDIKDAIAEYLKLCYKGVRRRDIDYFFFEEQDDQ